MDAAAVDHVLHIDEAPQLQVARDAHRVVDDVLLLPGLEPWRRVDGVGVARVHARALDVLHDARNHDRLAVGDRVDLHLDALQVLVHQHLASRHRSDRPDHVAPQLLAVADDLHRPAAEDVGRTHEDRIAAALRDRLRLLDRRRRAAHRLRDADRVQRARERAPVLGEIDRLDARAEDRDLVVVQRLREVDGGLAAELDERAARLLSPGHMQGAVEVERLEVETIRRVEVGRDRFGVGVDHDRAHARVSQRPGRVHGAVVELYALADPDRPRADDLDRAAVDRTRLVLLLPARVVVGSRRFELARARVDDLVRRRRTLDRLATESLDHRVGDAGAAQVAHSAFDLEPGDGREAVDEPAVDAAALGERRRVRAVAQ